MSYKLLCVNNDGFEDHITYGAEYPAEEVGTNGYLVRCDNGEVRWLGATHFAFT